MWHILLLLVAPSLVLTSEPQAPSSTTETTPQERWLNVRLNHMMADNTDTFPMRFYYNHLSGSTENIVIFVGGDWEISPGWASGGLGAELANNLQGSLFYTEHRYYGQSRPGNDTQVSGLRFLTVDQALGDLAQVIQHIKSDDFEFGRYRSAQVVLVGCGLGGSLATWMRLAYPHLVQAVVADSSPLYAREELPEFLVGVLETLRVLGIEQCAGSVLQAFADIESVVEAQPGQAQVSQMFNTCAPLTATPMDQATFWATVTAALAELVVDHPDDIQAACATLTNPAVGTPMQRLADWLAEARGGACLETRYITAAEALADADLESPLVNTRLWLYQACSQFGWLPSSAGVLPGAVPAEYYHQLCKDVFSDYFDESFLRASISRTNLMFAGLSHTPDYVISVRAGLDPWDAVGPNATHATAKAPVYEVLDGMRCAALGSLTYSSTPEQSQLRINIWNDVQYFVRGTLFAAAPPRTYSALLLAVAVALLALR